MGFFNFSPHKYTISLPLFLSQLRLSLSLCLYSCVFVRFVFVVLVVVVGALPITKCLLCLVRVAPPPFLLLLLLLLCHASFSFPQRGTNVCTQKKETYNVEHVLLRFRFFGPDFPPRGKKEEEEEN